MARRLIILSCFLLLAAQLIFQIFLAKLDAPTTDESVHLAAGYSYLTQGDFRFNPEHPPLVKVLAALPLLTLSVTQPASFSADWSKAENFFYDSWRENRHYGEQLLFGAGNNPDQLIFLARLPMVLLTLLLGLAIFWIAVRHWGEYAAVTAVSLYVFNPTVTGHGHLITTDIALSLGVLLSLYAAWRLSRQPSWLNAVWLGLALGLALLTKHTAVILLPLLLMMWLANAIWRKRLATGLPLGAKPLLTILVAWVVIWAGFGFHDRLAPKTTTVSRDIIAAYVERGQVAAGVEPSPTVDRIYQRLRPLAALLPGDYLKGIAFVFIHSSNGHESFLLGSISRTGWWYYFPAVFLFKTPLPTLLLVGLPLYLLARRRLSDSLVTTLAVGAGAFLGVAMLSKANLGVRHILPILPPLLLMAGAAISKSSWWQKRVVFLLALSGLVLIASYPNYLSYFNEVAGGSRDGYRIATDSNLDWGQDMKRIAAYIKETGLDRPYVEYSWLSQAGLDYYLGHNYRLPEFGLLPSQARLIIGGSALNQPQYGYIQASRDCRHVTAAVFDCQIPSR